MTKKFKRDKLNITLVAYKKMGMNEFFYLE